MIPMRNIAQSPRDPKQLLKIWADLIREINRNPNTPYHAIQRRADYMRKLKNLVQELTGETLFNDEAALKTAEDILSDGTDEQAVDSAQPSDDGSKRQDDQESQSDNAAVA